MNKKALRVPDYIGHMLDAITPNTALLQKQIG